MPSIRHRYKVNQSRRERYCRDVLAELATISPEHAEALNARGTALGWWFDVYYHFDHGRTPVEVARGLAARSTR